MATHPDETDAAAAEDRLAPGDRWVPLVRPGQLEQLARLVRPGQPEQLEQLVPLVRPGQPEQLEQLAPPVQPGQPVLPARLVRREQQGQCSMLNRHGFLFPLSCFLQIFSLE